MDFRTAVDRIWKRWTLACEIAFTAGLLACLFFAFAAFAQNTEVLTPAPLEIDPHNTALQLLDAIKNGQWWLVASLGVSLMTWGVRAGLMGKALTALGAVRLSNWLTSHPVVGYSIPIVLSAIGGVTTAFASGMPFTWGSLVGEILKVAFGAIALFIAKKTIEESRAAGKDAAAKVVTQADANRELLKP